MEYISSKDNASRIDIKVEVADSLGLSEELRNIRYDSNSEKNIIENRVEFAISALKRARLITSIKRGVYKATDLGDKLFKEHLFKLDRSIIESTKEYIDYYKKDNQKNIEKDERISETETFDLLENIQEKIEQVKSERAGELLDLILASSPYLFEELVVRLLSRMGYKGSKGSSFVTNKSGDGGIDGIIYQDPLGVHKVYLQAKRYTKQNVQRTEIEAFFGALTNINAKSGVFITTSDFSKGAKESAKKFSIVLVNKEKLIDLLLEYEIGIKKDQIFYTGTMSRNRTV
jgi:restriction system protein